MVALSMKRVGRSRLKNTWLAFWAGRGMSHGKREVTSEDLRRADFPTSTQRMGVRFSQRIRDTFRFRWLRGGSAEKD